MAEIRLTRKLYDIIRDDIARPHQFAAERIGFAFGKLGSQESAEPLVLLHRYVPVPDEQYILDPKVGARINGDAITEAMEQVMKYRIENEGAFHVHVHDHNGQPGLSGTDRREIPLLIPSFKTVGKGAAHGLIIFSRNHGISWVWMPGHQEPVTASRIVIVGAPLSIFEAKQK